MIQAPQNYGMPQAVQQQNRRPAYAPSYNAVQINLDTPTLNAPPAMPYYPPVNMEQYQPPVQNTPAQQAPVATVPTMQPQMPQVPVMPQVPQTQVPPPVLDTTQQVPAAQPQVEIKPAEDKASVGLAEEAFKGLSSNDYDTQALAMEEIAKKGLNGQDVTPYVQENIIDKLIEIMNVDTANLPGATEQQIDLRSKLAANNQAKAEAEAAKEDPEKAKLPYELTQQQVEEANRLSPYEQAERNKEYAMFTTAILQKTYADEVEKQSGLVEPITELPGSRAIISILKNSDSTDMAVAAIDALRYVQRPEYKDDLTTLYTIAQTDARPEVVEAATQALASLNEPEQKK